MLANDLPGMDRELMLFCLIIRAIRRQNVVVHEHDSKNESDRSIVQMLHRCRRPLCILRGMSSVTSTSDLSIDEIRLDPWHRFYPLASQKRVRFHLTMRNAFSSDGYECPICYDPICADTYTRIPCKHVFHETCFFEWCREKTPLVTCPMCKRLYICYRVHDTSRMIEFSEMYPLSIMRRRVRFSTG